MEKLKKILLPVGVVIFFAVFAVAMLTSDLEHIEDTNGADNYSLQQINDYNIINMDIGALNYNEERSFITEAVTYCSDKFTGVAEIFGENLIANRFEITVNHASVSAGNFKMVLLQNDEIVHEFELNELTQTFVLEKPKGYISLRIAGESAAFSFDYSII